MTSDWFSSSAAAPDKIDDVPKPKSTFLSIFSGNKQKDTSENKSANIYVKNNTKNRNGHRMSQFCERTGHDPKLCTTKRNNSVLDPNFLNACGGAIDAKEASIPVSTRQITKKLFQSANLKKKIAPMNDKQADSLRNSIEVLDVQSTNSLTKEFSIDSKLSEESNMYPEEQGNFVMLPTNTLNLEEGLNKFEVQARKKLEELGITEQMICDAIEAGPRSDIIGAYRVIVHRLQKEESKDLTGEPNASLLVPRRPRKISKACILL